MVRQRDTGLTLDTLGRSVGLARGSGLMVRQRNTGLTLDTLGRSVGVGASMVRRRNTGLTLDTLGRSVGCSVRRSGHRVDPSADLFIRMSVPPSPRLFGRSFGCWSVSGRLRPAGRPGAQLLAGQCFSPLVDPLVGRRTVSYLPVVVRACVRAFGRSVGRLVCVSAGAFIVSPTSAGPAARRSVRPSARRTAGRSVGRSQSVAPGLSVGKFIARSASRLNS